jgi:hypothetical protein
MARPIGVSGVLQFADSIKRGENQSITIRTNVGNQRVKP